jgi:hypothetical protein
MVMVMVGDGVVGSGDDGAAGEVAAGFFDEMHLIPSSCCCFFSPTGLLLHCGRFPFS